MLDPLKLFLAGQYLESYACGIVGYAIFHWFFENGRFIPEQFAVKAQEPLIQTWLYKMVASMEAAIFNCQCDQMQNCEGDCETMCLCRLQASTFRTI